MKPIPNPKMTANMEPLNAFVDAAERVSDIRLEFKSPIHLRITVNRKWTDFWPTTGKWFDSDTRKKGTDVQWLIELLERRCGMHGPAPAPKTRETHQPTIRERLAIIDLNIAAIRAELFPKGDPEPPLTFIGDDLVTEGPRYEFEQLNLPATEPSTTLPVKSYASVSDLLAEVEGDDSPPWNP